MADDLTNHDPEVLLNALRQRSGQKSATGATPPEVEAASDEEVAAAMTTVMKSIYGTDDRQDSFEVTDPTLLSEGAATVALVRPAQVTDNGDGTTTISGPTLGSRLNLCPTEKFRDQPAIAFCTGFLVASDVVATAGHCLDASNLDDVVLVFGFEMTDVSTARTTVPTSDVYRPTAVLGHHLGASDWAVVRIDRPASGRVPLQVRQSGKVPDDETLHVMGHPSGLPRKTAGNAAVRDNSPSTHFVANLDTFGGNSGSPVFSSGSHLVEGILVRGETDYVQVGDCRRAVVCPDNGCRGEDVTRATEFATVVPSSGGGGSVPPYPGRLLRYPPTTEGPDVTAWQTRMTALGFGLVVDGKYGPKSKAACVELQQARGLAADGIVGPMAWAETFE
ncbi:MAG: trypsin-like peptidase domain-containing protein [Ornithinimicrobium sp.]